MNITLYQNLSDKRCLNKNITEIEHFTDVNILEQTTTTNPTFILKSTTQAINANYLYCNLLNRYYFINEWVMMSGQRIGIKCSVDVLYTYREQIYQLSATMLRNEHIGVNYIPDQLLPILQDKKYYVADLGENVLNLNSASDSTYNFVINVAGGGKNENI